MSSKPTPEPGIAQNMLADRQSLPGLIPQEIVIFKAWWADHYREYDSADFNVRVGTGFDPGDKFTQDVRTSTIANSQRRIDALLQSGNLYTIVEVKYRASPLAIGQLLCYRELLRLTRPEILSTSMLLLCFTVDADTIYCAGRLGVTINRVSADFTGIKITKQD
jgi:hypothetical protein